MGVYKDLANIIHEYGDKITLHKHHCSEPHAIYYLYYNQTEFRWSFGSHGEYGIGVKSVYINSILNGTLMDGDRWSINNEAPIDIPEELVGLVAEMKYYFKKQEKNE